MEEAMRCELKLPVKRTARIHCGGCVPTGALASRNPVEGETPTATVTMAMRVARTMEVATTVVTMAMKTPSDYIRCVVELAVNPSGISTCRPMNVSKPWKR
jgi:hypothetical protein